MNSPTSKHTRGGVSFSEDMAIQEHKSLMPHIYNAQGSDCEVCNMEVRLSSFRKYYFFIRQIPSNLGEGQFLWWFDASFIGLEPGRKSTNSIVLPRDSINA